MAVVLLLVWLLLRLLLLLLLRLVVPPLPATAVAGGGSVGHGQPIQPMPLAGPMPSTFRRLCMALVTPAVAARAAVGPNPMLVGMHGGHSRAPM